MGEDKIILFLDDDSHHAAIMYQRMSPKDRNRTIWATTVAEAISILSDYTSRLDRVWLDHDLGGKQYVHSGREDCGMEVIRWLEKQSPLNYSECHFIMHSWNLPAAKRMAQRLNRIGYSVTQVPFGM